MIRKSFVCVLSAYVLLISGVTYSQNSPINRYELVTRHNVSIDKIDPMSPLTVGNGDFAYTVDVTGLQTFGDYYYENGIPLETMSNWGWHSFPNTENLTLEDAQKEYDFHGGKVPYASLEKSPAGQYFRKNPHRIPLGQLPFMWAEDTDIYPYAYYDEGRWLVGEPARLVSLLVGHGWSEDPTASVMFPTMIMDYVWPESACGLRARFDLTSTEIAS